MKIFITLTFIITISENLFATEVFSQLQSLLAQKKYEKVLTIVDDNEKRLGSDYEQVDYMFRSFSMMANYKIGNFKQALNDSASVIKAKKNGGSVPEHVYSKAVEISNRVKSSFHRKNILKAYKERNVKHRYGSNEYKNYYKVFASQFSSDSCSIEFKIVREWHYDKSGKHGVSNIEVVSIDFSRISKVQERRKDGTNYFVKMTYMDDDNYSYIPTLLNVNYRHKNMKIHSYKDATISEDFELPYGTRDQDFNISMVSFKLLAKACRNLKHTKKKPKGISQANWESIQNNVFNMNTVLQTMVKNNKFTNVKGKEYGYLNQKLSIESLDESRCGVKIKNRIRRYPTHSLATPVQKVYYTLKVPSPEKLTTKQRDVLQNQKSVKYGTSNEKLSASLLILYTNPLTPNNLSSTHSYEVESPSSSMGKLSIVTKGGKKNIPQFRGYLAFSMGIDHNETVTTRENNAFLASMFEDTIRLLQTCR